MNLRIDMKIITLEPQANGLTMIEGHATDGTTVMVTVRVAEPLAVGGWMTMALFAEPAAAQPAAPAQSMRERMQARASGVASPAVATRSASAAGSMAAPTASGAGEAASLLLSSILGSRGDAAKTSDLFDNAPLVARNVDDEMDALLGAPRKG